MKLSPIIRGIASCKVGNGNTALFWKDQWNNRIMQDIYPCLFSYAQDGEISVANFSSSGNIIDVFHLPLSPEAFHQYQEVQEITQNLNKIDDENGVWSFKWKYYKFVRKIFDPPIPFSWIWKFKLWPKLKGFCLVASLD
jgi:hypothetical protein